MTDNSCPNCNTDLNTEEIITREYINKDDNSSVFALGHYSLDPNGHQIFISDSFEGFGEGRYDCADNSDRCSACDCPL